MGKRFWGFVEKYVTRKIGVEIACCLMFFLALCFYCGYRLIYGELNAEILHMFEMVMLAYILGWIQSLIGSDFDEADRLGIKDWAVVIAGAGIYAAASWIFGWFGRDIWAVVLFGVYMVIAYLCSYLVYAMKRAIDAKLLNVDLKQFQQRNK